jgi:Tol biopolymer transport system component
MRRTRRAVVTVMVALTVGAPAAALGAAPGSTLLVSRPDGTAPAPAALADSSDLPGAVSADGRYVAFLSDADGLAPGGDPRVKNVFLRDTLTNTTTLVSRSDGAAGVGANAESDNADIVVSPAGHVVVAFTTQATNLVDHATGQVGSGANAVWLRDVTAGTTTLVSRHNGMTGAEFQTDETTALAWSAGGPLVAFRSQGEYFLRTVDAGATELFSCTAGNCAGANPGQVSAAENADLRVVPSAAGTPCAPPMQMGPCALVTFTAQGAAPDSSGSLFEAVVGVAAAPVSDGAPTSTFGAFQTVSRGIGGAQADQRVNQATFDRDGTAVAFLTTADNMTEDTLPASHPQEAYVRVLAATPIMLLSRVGATGAVADADIDTVALGGDATHLRAVFGTDAATNLGGSGPQTYVRDVPTATTSLLNRAPGALGAPGDGGSNSAPAISADGSTALFASFADNLGAGLRRFKEVYVRRLDAPAQPVSIVSLPTGTALLGDGTSDSDLGDGAGPELSANGRFVAFRSSSTDLTPDTVSGATQIYVRDLVTGHTVLASRATGPNGAVLEPDAETDLQGISADGRRVVFDTDATNIDPASPSGVEQVYVRDLDANTTTLVGRDSNGTPAASGANDGVISADGKVVAFRSFSALDPAAASSPHTHVYVRNLAAQTTTLVDRQPGLAGAVAGVAAGEIAIDADGGRVAFESAATLADAPNDAKTHIYVRDVAAATTTLVSRADGATGASAGDNARDPAIDAAGNVVAFDSTAQNLGTAGPATPRVYVRDGVHTELISQSVDGIATPTSAQRPSIDASGNRVSFIGDGLQTPDPPNDEAYVRDRAAQTTSLVSRADGPNGAPADGDVVEASISPSGDCVAFYGLFTNLADGFGSPDFDSVHLRVLDNTCPGPAPTGSGATGPGTGGGGGGGGTTTPAAPVLSRLSLSPSRFHVGGTHAGTTVRFTLSAAARVTLHVDRLAPGHRRGKRCVSTGHGRACTRYVSVGSLTVSGRKGANRVHFSGRLKGHALRLARYRLTATPVHGKPHTATFTVVAAPKHRAAKH